MIRYRTTIDISRPLDRFTVTYPSVLDTPFAREELRNAPEKPYAMNAKLTMGAHSGTHVDAPLHVLEATNGVDRSPLSAMIGQCRVLDMTHVADLVRITDLEMLDIREGERLLFKTRNSIRGFKEWYDDFVALDGDAAEWLAAKKVLLVGIDGLSIKQRHVADNRAHTALLEKGIVIVEGLSLGKVTPGPYDLVVLPLRVIDGDGAPARAVLLTE